MCNLHCSSTFVFHQPLQNSLLSLFLHAIQQLQAFLLSSLGYKPFIGSQEPNCGHKRTIWRWSFDLTHNKNRAIIWKIQKLSLLSQFFFLIFLTGLSRGPSGRTFMGSTFCAVAKLFTMTLHSWLFTVLSFFHIGLSSQIKFLALFICSCVFSYIFKLAHCNRHSFQDVRKFIRPLIRVNNRECMHQRDKTTSCSPYFCHRSFRSFCQNRKQGEKERNWKLPTSSLQESPQKASHLIESPGTDIRSERMSKGTSLADCEISRSSVAHWVKVLLKIVNVL